jgi:hypothetical protein
VGRRFAVAVSDVLQLIADAPLQFPKHAVLTFTSAGERRSVDIHKAVLARPFPYVIFFCIRAGTALVLAIAHARRPPGYWAERV